MSLNALHQKSSCECGASGRVRGSKGAGERGHEGEGERGGGGGGVGGGGA